MRKINIISIISITIICLAFVFCRKDGLINNAVNEPKPDVLPEATQEGKNTFGCLIDGKVWLPKRNPGFLSNKKELYLDNYPINTLRIWANKDDIKPSEGISLFATNINFAGSYKLSLGFDPGKTYYYKNNNIYLLNDTINSNLVITKYDTINKIISGGFNFKVIIDSKVVNITNGVFDIKY